MTTTSVPAASSTYKKVALAATIGNTVETYDFAVYAFLSTVLAKLFFPASEPGVGLLFTFAVFGVAFAARPLGSFIFGPLSDRIGRQPTLVVTLLVMAGATTLIGVLPTASAIGIGAPILLTTLRLVQGLAVGGEYSSALIYVAEFAPKRKRGRITSIVQVGSLSGLLIAAVVVLSMNSLLSADQLLAWGWRLPFLVALPLGAVGIYLRTRLGETPEFVKLETSHQTVKTPMRSAFVNHWPKMLLIAGISALHIVGFYMIYTYLQSFIGQLGYTTVEATLVVVVALVLGLGLVPFGGWLSDRWGRRPVLLTASVAVLVLAYPLFAALYAAPNLAVVIIAVVLLSAGPTIYAAVAPVTYIEAVPASVRGTVFGIAYNVMTAALGGSALFVSQWLVNTTGDPRSPAFLLMAAAAVSVVAAFFVRRSSPDAVLTDDPTNSLKVECQPGV